MSQQRQTIPWPLIETTLQLTNFSSADQVVWTTDKIPDGYLCIIRDANVIFTTSGGSVYFRKLAKGGNTVKFTDNFSTTATGLNALVVGGDRLQICIGSTGSGVIDVLWHGELIPINTSEELKKSEQHLQIFGDGI